MATNDLTTLADVKAWLNIASGDTTFDAMLGRLISACSMFMQAYMNRTVAITSYTLNFNGDGKTAKMLGNYPIQSVTSVLVNGVPIPASPALTAYGTQQAGYMFDDDTIYLYGYEFCMGVQNCSIAYTAGFSASDPNLMALAQACIEVVSLRFKERGRIGEKNKSVNGELIGFMVTDFPPDVVTLMNNLRNVTPV